MPRIQRSHIPRQLFAHLLDRIKARNISADQLGLLAEWLDAKTGSAGRQMVQNISRPDGLRRRRTHQDIFATRANRNRDGNKLESMVSTTGRNLCGGSQPSTLNPQPVRIPVPDLQSRRNALQQLETKSI
jgi:hypothetical protein